MSYHIVSIDEPQCSITVSRGQLLVSSADGRFRSIPMEDIASIVITSFKCSMTNAFLIESARLRIGVVLCSSFSPVSVVLPIDRATDTAIIRNLAGLTPLSKRRLWAKTLKAKCLNQCFLAGAWMPDHDSLPVMRRLALSDKETREAEVAKLYWGVFADKCCNGTFVRKKDGGGVNSLLNYSYAILLSLVLRNLLALGIDPTFGIFHMSRAHSTPLAYDLMEPFRVVFDQCVADWIQEQGEPRAEDNPISKEYRLFIGKALDKMLDYQGENITLRLAVEKVIRSFRRAVEDNQVGPYEPWITSTTKWVG
ncbi:MAG: type II CRISPR-associated endonuclease Cas1 [Akkermansia sp.]|nr:type II CRISPR-associated endonuclease Cas1 [Akkermansia sp.]